MDKVIQGVLIAVIILGSGYLAYSFVVPAPGMPEISIIDNDTAPEETNEPPEEINLGTPVDHETYLQIQDLMLKTPLAQPEVIEGSLVFYDIDNDGDDDVLGFLKLTFNPDDSVYIFKTWHRDGEIFYHYEAIYYDFRFGGRFDTDTSCSISNLATLRVTLTCNESGQEYSLTLLYQYNGSGYYRDVDAHAITFDGNTDWIEYSSGKAGVQFSYPSDLEISEKTYEIYDDLITITSAKRGDDTLFEISTVPQQGDLGWGAIDISSKTIFLKLVDENYLSRDWMSTNDYLPLTGIFYLKTEVFKENTEGSISSRYKHVNIEGGRGYTLFTPLTEESDLKEIDNIFSSLQYLETPIAQDDGAVTPQNNLISLADLVELQIPGSISDNIPSPIENSDAIEYRDLEITMVDSLIYQPSFLNMELYPFESIGKAGPRGGGGYNLEKEGCFNSDYEVVSAPEKVGVNEVCWFGWSDHGLSSSQGYYILDPNEKYILKITQKSEYSDYYEILNVNLKEVVESVTFSTQ